jgi:hypothetical protein
MLQHAVFIPFNMATAALPSAVALSSQCIVAMFSQEYCCCRRPNTEQIRILLFVQRSKLVFCQLQFMLLLHLSRFCQLFAGFKEFYDRAFRDH